MGAGRLCVMGWTRDRTVSMAAVVDEAEKGLVKEMWSDSTIISIFFFGLGIARLVQPRPGV